MIHVSTSLNMRPDQRARAFLTEGLNESPVIALKATDEDGGSVYFYMTPEQAMDAGHNLLRLGVEAGVRSAIKAEAAAAAAPPPVEAG